MTKDKVLIIDDSISARMEIKRHMADEFDVIEASNGPDGIQVFRDHADVVLIICDFNMPHMDGLTTMEHIYEEHPDTKVPCLMVTTESSTDLKNKGREIGVTGWVLKPIIPQVLIDACKDLVKEGRA